MSNGGAGGAAYRQSCCARGRKHLLGPKAIRACFSPPLHRARGAGGRLKALRKCVQVTPASTLELVKESAPAVKLDDKHYKLVRKHQKRVDVCRAS